MNQQSTREKAEKRSGHARFNSESRVTDSSGYVVFSQGDEGAAHVMAHEMLDQDEITLGHASLGTWLDGRTGSGSDWTHLQFHMAIFELGVGDWEAAYARFLAEILPIAETTEDALTDAPGLLWRLAIMAPERLELPWEPLRRTAVRSMRRLREPFVELHHLLAFAGAGDRDGIEAWVRIHTRQIHSQRELLVVQAGHALRAYVDEAYGVAAMELERLAPLMSMVGGSRAQNELFKELADYSWQRARDSDLVTRYAGVA